MASSPDAIVDTVWIPHPDLVWVRGRRVGDSLFELNDGKWSLYSPMEIVFCDTIGEMSSDESENLALVVDRYSNREVLHYIRQRYQRDKVNTWIGPLLVVVNPRRPMSLYTARTLDLYLKGGSKRNEPHAFAVAANALSDLTKKNRSQWIVAVGSRMLFFRRFLRNSIFVSCSDFGATLF
jgi:myosin heavy subunit